MFRVTCWPFTEKFKLPKCSQAILAGITILSIFTTGNIHTWSKCQKIPTVNSILHFDYAYTKTNAYKYIIYINIYRYTRYIYIYDYIIRNCITKKAYSKGIIYKPLFLYLMYFRCLNENLSTELLERRSLSLIFIDFSVV